jgi:hypothetical protein
MVVASMASAAALVRPVRLSVPSRSIIKVAAAKVGRSARAVMPAADRCLGEVGGPVEFLRAGGDMLLRRVLNKSTVASIGAFSHAHEIPGGE